jgi:hypothetical protein
MLLRARMSRLTRATRKFVPSARASGVSPVPISRKPIDVLPTRPVSRAPARIGTRAPSLRPIRREKKRMGISPWFCPAAPAKSKTLCPSRKKSRFSGKN